MTSSSPTWRLLTVGALLVGGYGLAVVASGFRLIPTDIASNALGDLLRLHIATASLALVLVPWQLLSGTRSGRSRAHRWTGRAYGAVALVAGVSGTAAASGTSHGPVAATGLATLGVLWTASTVLAVRAVRRRQIALHRRWALRSFALAYAAVALRLYLGLSGAAGVAFDDAYPAITWLCWVPNLLLVERVLRGREHRVTPLVGP